MSAGFHQDRTAHASRPRAGVPARRASGFTLLEVLLVLLLTALLLVAIAMAVDLHLRVANLGRRHVEEAQLARVILQRIADDIRRAVREPPATEEPTFAGLGSSGNSSGSSGSPGGSESGSNASAGAGTGQSGEDLDLMDMLGMDASLLGTSAGAKKPGIKGGSDWIQIDASWAVQPAMFEMVRSGWNQSLDSTASWSGADNLLGDVKTIIYTLNWGQFSTSLATSASMGSLSTALDQTLTSAGAWSLSLGDLPPGLYRREADRAVSCWAEQQGLADATSEFYESDLLAPEVESLAFAYFDGTEWLDSWDSQAHGGLPTAVEIVLTINMEPVSEMSLLAPAANRLDMPPINEPTVYRLVVYLPTGGATESSTASEETAPEETGAAESSSAASSASGTGGTSG